MNHKKLTAISFLMIFLGIIGRIYAASTTCVDANGILHDSIFLPLGTFLILLGFLGLAGAGCRALLSKFWKN